MVKRDKRRADHGDSVVRGRLLAAATELFTIKGYAATSVREIVEAAGVSKPVLYYWFGNKEGIYLELMTEPFGRFTALLEECLGTAGSPCGRLVDLLDRTLMLVRENLGGTRLMYSIYYGPPRALPLSTSRAITAISRTPFGNWFPAASRRASCVRKRWTI